jgi:uncharacterized DUF497 family protein
MEFEWDDQKNKINIEKHGIDFNFAKEVFSVVWISKPDNRKDYGEERLIALGLLGEFVLVIVYTLRGEKIRLISTRLANAEERSIYYAYVEKGTIKDPWSDERI